MLLNLTCLIFLSFRSFMVLMYYVLFVDYWLFVVYCSCLFLLVVGHWLLVIGHWLLVVGYGLLRSVGC